MNELTFDILKIIVSVCAALITAYVIPYLKTLKEDKRYESIVNIVDVAVKAAEQTHKASGQGSLKRSEVIKFVSDWMTTRGFKISEDEIEQLLESSVYTLKQEQ